VYRYNYELEIPGQPASSDLEIMSVPTIEADALICGVAAPETPAPFDPVTITDPPVSPEPAPGPGGNGTDPGFNSTESPSGGVNATESPTFAPTAAPSTEGER